MTSKTRALTVQTKWLLAAADTLVREANESLTAWVILGTANRYGENIGKAAVLRRAAEIKSIADRRQFLRGNGVDA
jgi:hypothetical protein